ncbi:hypothetical protein SAY86_024214 [Trapa natans]|uniref:Uncharacterized protein n=1 Tax=Trapa natans TaxID=22666 RepID=A0AAN7LX07_TRANT|nr:hypothetical protein SAY86_024214 [Trapa natans]
MAKGSKGRHWNAYRQFRPKTYPFRKLGPSISDLCHKNCPKVAEKGGWEDIMCSVCMEYPHNAVLLLCASHEKGCRPYMCGTSCRYSNCLEQYKKAYSKVTTPNYIGAGQGSANDPVLISDSSLPTRKSGVSELVCPLCRGQVKGWTVVEQAREYLNRKKRTCMHEDCSFVGTYKELRKHVRAEHPYARPREVDPALEQEWRQLERERERDDVMSTIRSTMPGAMVLGDYVIEGGQIGFGAEDVGQEQNGDGIDVGFDGNLVNVFLLLNSFGQRVNTSPGRRLRRAEGAAGVGHIAPLDGSDAFDQDEFWLDNDDVNLSLARRLRRHGRILLGRAARRLRHREENRNGGESR